MVVVSKTALKLMPQVSPDSYLTLHYRLAGADGSDIVNTFAEKPATLTLGAGQLAPPIEARLLGMEEGTHTTLTLSADEAFGSRNTELLQWVTKSLLAAEGDPQEQYQVGDVVQFAASAGRGGYTGVVKDTRDDAVLMDFNHPLAGQPLTFEVKLIGVL
jgi:FKBP-type peptidyl-prolyl cis-trans isomerase SlpA